MDSYPNRVGGDWCDCVCHVEAEQKSTRTWFFLQDWHNKPDENSVNRKRLKQAKGLKVLAIVRPSSFHRGKTTIA